jgi:hypothetical protein
VIHRTLLVALFGCIAVSTASAQETPAPARIWAGAGLAMAGNSDVSGIGLSGQLVYQKHAHQLGVRGLAVVDLSQFPDGGDDTIGELGILYGRTRMFGSGHVSLSAGASMVGLDPCPHDDDPCFVLGVPIVAEAALSAKVTGIGLQVFGNVNSKAPYAGVALFLQLGWLP